MSALDDLVEGLKRELAVPGEFARSFPNTTDDDLVGSLADAFGAAQLDGFFGNQVLNPDLGEVTPDLSMGGGALVVQYATERVLLSRLRELNTKTTYKAGPVEYATETSASVLAGQLQILRDRRANLLVQAKRAMRGTNAIYMVDAYSTRATAALMGHRWHFYGYELAGLTYGLAGLG